MQQLRPNLQARVTKSITVCVLVLCLFSIPNSLRAQSFAIGDGAENGAHAPRSGGQSGSVNETGINAQLGHIGFETLGRDTGITRLQIMPYVRDGNQVLFGQLRGFGTNDGQFGGNIGAGARNILNGILIGGSLWYDIDETTGELFHQVGANLEVGNEFAVLTSNLYVPVSSGNKQYRQTVKNERFVGNQILFDVDQLMGEALTGFDVNLVLPVPGDFAEHYAIDTTLGYYFFQGGANDSINGFRFKLQGEINDMFALESTFTYDQTFGVNGTLGIAYNFGTNSQRPTGIDRRLMGFVDRNDNIIVDRFTKTKFDVVAINPATGTPFNVQHVSDTGGSTAAGTAGDPLDSIAGAQTAGGDLIFVHGGSTLTENIVLTDGQILLGEGITHTLFDDVYGLFTVPTATMSTVTPTILNSTGDAITLADNNLVSNFLIEGAAGSGIVANGVNASRVRSVTVDGAMMDGVAISNITGAIDFIDLSVMNSGQNGISIDGDDGTITFFGNTTIQDSTNAGLSIMNLSTTTITNPDSSTTDVLGTAQFQNLSITETTGADAISLMDNDGDIYFDNLDIETSGGGRGIVSRNSENVSSSRGDISTVGAAAIDTEDSTVNLFLTSVSTDGGANAIRMIRTDGRILVFGGGALGSGGTIQNTTTAIVMEDSGILGLQAVDLTDNQVVADIDNSEGLEFSLSRITGTTQQVINALNLKNLDLGDSLLENNVTTTGSHIHYAVDQNGSYVVAILANDLLDTTDTLLEVEQLNNAISPVLALTYMQNQVELSGNGAKAADVNWIGSLQSTISGNQVLGSDDDQVAFDINNGHATASTNLLFQSNTIGLMGDNSIGLDVMSTSTAVIEMRQNLMGIGGGNGTSIRISGDDEGDYGFFENTFTATAGGATAVRFLTIDTGSNIIFSANSIDYSTVNTFIDSGIDIDAVTGASPVVNLSSNANNVMLGVDAVFDAPASTTSGGILINNVLFP